MTLVKRWGVIALAAGVIASMGIAWRYRDTLGPLRAQEHVQTKILETTFSIPRELLAQQPRSEPYPIAILAFRLPQFAPYDTERGNVFRRPHPRDLGVVYLIAHNGRSIAEEKEAACDRGSPGFCEQATSVGGGFSMVKRPLLTYGIERLYFGADSDGPVFIRCVAAEGEPALCQTPGLRMYGVDVNFAFPERFVLQWPRLKSRLHAKLARMVVR